MYSASGLAERSDWIAQYAPLVKRIAHYMMAKLPASVEIDDIVQAGMVGLLDAVTRYEETQGAQFETYAVQRIRGAILDELRRNDWLPRSTRKSMREIESAINVLQQRRGRSPSEAEIAEQMQLPLAQYQQRLQEARGHQILYYEDISDPETEHYQQHRDSDDHPTILDTLIDDELRALVAEAVAALPEREKLMMSLYYEKELNLREIGEVLGVSESRVCQIHTQAVARLRARIRNP